MLSDAGGSCQSAPADERCGGGPDARPAPPAHGQAAHRAYHLAMSGRIALRAESVEAVLDPGAGGRIASLRVDGLELLVTEGSGPVAWGCYPMVPWAGRVRDGVLRWRGEEHRLPTDVSPAARDPRDAPRDRLGGRRRRARRRHAGRRPRSAMAVRRSGRPPGHADSGQPARGAGGPRRRPPDAGHRGLAPLVPTRAPRRYRSRRRRASGRRSRRRGDAPPRRRRAPGRRDGPADPARAVGRLLRRPGRRPGVHWPGALEVRIASDAPCWVVYTENRDGRLRRAPDRTAERPQHGRARRGRAGRAAASPR